MSPRAYAMQRRAELRASTRERIVDAATALYSERGIRATSVLEVARRADVSPGTVLNHFGTGDGLASAVLEGIASSFQLPTVRLFQGARTRPERVRRLVTELFALYDRFTPWFEVFRNEFEVVPALRVATEGFWKQMEALYAEALGPLMENELVRRTIVGLSSPPTLAAMREAGLSMEQAAAVIGDLVGGEVERAVRRTKRR